MVRRHVPWQLSHATSARHVGTGAEKDVQSSLDQLRKAGCTSLVIAHRLTTVQSADLIIVMVEGECVERGTHAQLMAKNNIYASLVCQIDLSDGRESDDSAQLDQSMGRDSEGSACSSCRMG